MCGIERFLLLLVMGCAGGSETREEATPSLPQAEACDRYLSCAAETTPSAMGPLLDAYGIDGTCWESGDDAELCTTACEVGLEQLQAMDSALEGSSACWPDDAPLREGRYALTSWCGDALMNVDRAWLDEVDDEGFVLSDAYGGSQDCRFDDDGFICDDGAFGTVLSPTSWQQVFYEDDWFCEAMRVEAEWEPVD